MFHKFRKMMGMETNESRVIEQNVVENVAPKSNSNNKERYKGGFYILGLSGLTAAVAGLVTSRVAKRSARENLRELGKEQKIVMESPHALALRALAWGTFWAVGIFSLSIFGLWKLFGLKDLEDLRARIRKHRRQPTESEGRTEFENLSDFLNYLNETSKSKSSAKDT